MSPSVVISLDYELRWGVADKLPDSAGAYRAHLDGESDAVFNMLELFKQKDVGATWATVGAIACSDWDEYFERAPKPPAYRDQRLRFRTAWRDIDPQGKLHFAPDVVRAIADAQGQELASHTFSHIYYREEGCEREDVLADGQAIAKVMQERVGVTPTSLVFPRNQEAHTDALSQIGIRRWRTNPRVSYWNDTRRDKQSRLRRGMRMIESLAPIGTRRAPACEMRASYLVRFALSDAAWKLHARRIAGDAKNLRPGEALHLWWHPHNMGAAVFPNIRRLADLIDRIREAAPAGTRFLTMEESERLSDLSS